MARLTLLVVSPDAPPTLARHFGWRRPTLEVVSPDASACVARNKRDSCLTLSDLSPDTRRSASRGLSRRQLGADFSRKVGIGVARIGDACRYNDRVRVVLSTRVGSLYRMGSGRYIECGVVDLSTGYDSSYRLVEVDISPSRPSAGDLLTPLAISVYRFREVGLPTRMGSVYRQGQGRYTDMPQPGMPTRVSRSTDSYPLGLPTLPPPTGDTSNCRGAFSHCGFNELPCTNKWYNPSLPLPL